MIHEIRACGRNVRHQTADALNARAVTTARGGQVVCVVGAEGLRRRRQSHCLASSVGWIRLTAISACFCSYLFFKTTMQTSRPDAGIKRFYQSLRVISLPEPTADEALEMADEDFFTERADQSEVKARIVSKYVPVGRGSSLLEHGARAKSRTLIYLLAQEDTRTDQLQRRSWFSRKH